MIEQQLREFMVYAKAKGLDLTGDDQRFYRLKTARAWTTWRKRTAK